MLDLMRQANRRKWFVWTIILFVVMAFVLAIFAIWGGAATGGSMAASGGWVARVNGETISEREFQRLRSQLESTYRQQLGEMFDQFGPQLDLDRRAIGHLLGRSLAYGEAVRLGLAASDQEVAQAIVSMTVFHRDGRFIGREAYEHELRGRGYDVADFERSVGRDLAAERLRGIVDTLVTVADSEVDEAYGQQGETAEVDYVVAKTADFKTAGEPAAREVEEYFREHRDDYKTPERRRAAAAVVSRDSVAATLETSEAELREEYDRDRGTKHTAPEERRASHILFKVPQDSPEEAAVRLKAEQVLSQIRAGADFAEMARQHSEDTTAAAGGDLGWFGRGRMVPEFERATFALGEGQVGDLVRSPFGYHIIRQTGSRPAGVRPFDEVREQIRQQITARKAQGGMQKLADDFTARLAQQISSFETTATEMGLAVHDTGLIAQGDPIGPLGQAPQASAEMFRLQPGGRSGALPAVLGLVLLELKEVQAPAPAPFESVKDRVKNDVIESRSMQRARAAAAEIAAAGPDSFKAAADKRKLEVRSTGTITRSSAPAELGDALEEAVFSRRPGEIVGPIETTGGAAVARIIKRGPESTEEQARTRARLRAEILERKQEEAFGALLKRLEQSAAIENNPEFLASLTPRPAR